MESSRQERYMIEVEEALRLIGQAFEHSGALVGSDDMALETALGRVLSTPVECRLDHPGFDQSAMDGIAFRGASGGRLRVIGTVAAGDPPDQLMPGPGECVRIMTGAPVPSSTDTVEMVEQVRFETETDEAGNAREIAVLEGEIHGGRHIRRQGENARAGEPLYPEGTLVRAGELAGLLSQGVRRVRVRRKIRIGIATTGDEVVPYHRPLEPGQIYNTNALALAGLLEAPSVEIVQLGVFPDDLVQTRACLEVNTDLDVLVLTGGVSMGRFDFVPEAAERAGFVPQFHKVRMKPGKPLWFGRHPEGTFLFGLPGNPVSAMVGTLLFVTPLVRALATGSFREPLWTSMPLATACANRARFPFFAGGSFTPTSTGLHVTPLPTSGSGDVIRFSHWDTLIRLPPSAEFESETTVQVLLPFPK